MYIHTTASEDIEVEELYGKQWKWIKMNVKVVIGDFNTKRNQGTTVIT